MYFSVDDINKLDLAVKVSVHALYFLDIVVYKLDIDINKLDIVTKVPVHALYFLDIVVYKLDFVINKLDFVTKVSVGALYFLDIVVYNTNYIFHLVQMSVRAACPELDEGKSRTFVKSRTSQART